jgi:hypothetical protein
MSPTSAMSPPPVNLKPIKRRTLDSLMPLEIPDSIASLDSLPNPKPFTTKLGESDIAFLLIPINAAAEAIVLDNVTSERLRPNPENLRHKMLLISLDAPPNIAGKLVRFGRLDASRDLIFDADEFPLEDECCFTVHSQTGELRLHDLSDHQLTELWQGGKCRPDVFDAGTFRTFEVPLDKESYLSIGPAAFRLIPRPTSTREEFDAFKSDLIAYAKQPVSEKRLSPMPPIRVPWQLWSVRSRAIGRFNDTLFLPSRQPQRQQVCVAYKRVNQLGGPSPGMVVRVLEKESHRPLACKVVTLVNPSAEHTSQYTDYRKKAKTEQLTKLYHVSSYLSSRQPMLMILKKNLIPYWHSQEKRNRIEVFMPIYEGSMYTIMFWSHSVGYAVCHHLLDLMFPQIVLALDHLHEQGLVHGSVKPQNILHRGKQFCLADFGIAKDPKDAKSKWYRAPEVGPDFDPTEKSDIYSL